MKHRAGEESTFWLHVGFPNLFFMDHAGKLHVISLRKMIQRQEGTTHTTSKRHDPTAEQNRPKTAKPRIDDPWLEDHQTQPRQEQ